MAEKRTNFFRDKQEILLRSFWFAYKVYIAALENFSLTAISFWITDTGFREHDQRLFAEILGYTFSFALSRLSDDIQDAHGVTNESNILILDYQVCIGVALCRASGLGEERGSESIDLLQDYYSPDYDEGYDAFWETDQIAKLMKCDRGHIPDLDEFFQIMDKVEEVLTRSDEETEEERERRYTKTYNIDRYYAYRLSKCFNVVDRDKAIESVKGLYSHLALSFYSDAFFNLDTDTMKSELGEMMYYEKYE